MVWPIKLSLGRRKWVSCFCNRLIKTLPWTSDWDFYRRRMFPDQVLLWRGGGGAGQQSLECGCRLNCTCLWNELLSFVCCPDGAFLKWESGRLRWGVLVKWDCPKNLSIFISSHLQSLLYIPNIGILFMDLNICSGASDNPVPVSERLAQCRVTVSGLGCLEGGEPTVSEWRCMLFTI